MLELEVTSAREDSGAEPLVALHATTRWNVHIVHITAHRTILIASCVVLLVSSLGLLCVNSFFYSPVCAFHAFLATIVAVSFQQTILLGA